MGDMVPKKSLAKQGTGGVIAVIGGITLLTLNGMGVIASLIIGGILAVGGLLMSSDKDDRTSAMVITGAGVLTAATALPLLGGLAATILGISGIGLLAAGAVKLFKFIKGYRQNR